MNTQQSKLLNMLSQHFESEEKLIVVKLPKGEVKRNVILAGTELVLDVVSVGTHNYAIKVHGFTDVNSLLQANNLLGSAVKTEFRQVMDFRSLRLNFKKYMYIILHPTKKNFRMELED